jgi:hypothetical protein
MLVRICEEGIITSPFDVLRIRENNATGWIGLRVRGWTPEQVAS